MDVVKIPASQFADFKTRAKYLYQIRTKDNRLVGYQPNEAQIYLDQVRQEEFERSEAVKGVKQCKIILLKGRQIGGTTDTAMFNMDIMLNVNMAYGLILAHDDATTPIIYEKYRQAYLNLPDAVQLTEDDGTEILNEEGEPLIISIKPKVESFSGKQLKFEDKTQSRVLVRTAGSGDNVGRGDTLNYVHLSEFGSYDYAIDVLTAINQSLPKNSFVYSVIESTANGVSGKGQGFYELWKKSEQEWNKFKNGLTNSFEGYRPVFIPWYMMSEYRKPLIGGKLISLDGINFTPEQRKEFIETEEMLVEEVFDNKDDAMQAINWYRWCVKENCAYDINRAMREYPTTPEQAFISSDNSFFDVTRLFSIKHKYENEGEPDYMLGDLNDDYEFVEGRHGNLKIWEEPHKDYENRYIASCDPAYGIEEGDYACMMVYDRLDDKFVAKWYGTLKEDLLAEELVKLGIYYNHAMIIPESNLRTVVNLIEPNGIMPYPGEVYEYEYTSGRIDYGFQTMNNKKELVDNYIQWLREDYGRIRDISLIKEHTTFVKTVTNGRPKYGASEGSHDDQVIAMALCIWAANEWEEEIYTLDESKNDIDKIFESKTMKRKKRLRSSQLGEKYLTFNR